MSDEEQGLLDCCLYFTANSLARSISKIAELEFGKLGMVPSHAFLVMVAVKTPGVSQKEIAEQLQLAQSTVSRFTDAMILRGLVEKTVEGKTAHIYPTANAEKMMPELEAAWTRVYDGYSEVLGEEEGINLTALTRDAYKKMNEKLK